MLVRSIPSVNMLICLDSKSLVDLAIVVARLRLLLELGRHHIVVVALLIGLIHRSVTFLSIVLLRPVVLILRGWVIWLITIVVLRRISVKVMTDDLVARIVIRERALLAVVIFTVVFLNGG